MKARELFAVGIRLMGIWFWSQAILEAFWAYVKNAGVGLGNPAIPVREDLARCRVYLLLGTILFIGCNWLALLAYGGPEAARTAQENPPAA